MRVLSLFSGIGGFDLGLYWAGFETVAFCEIADMARLVLRKHWPAALMYSDVKELTYEKLKKEGISKIDAIVGGFPCQDISTAGSGKGICGKRSRLWQEYARLIGEIRPRYAIIENVAALRYKGKGLHRVLADLAAIGYDAEWHCIPASAVGAPHERDRVWVVAYPHEIRPQRSRQLKISLEAVCSSNQPQPIGVRHSAGVHSFRKEWSTKPPICRVADGVPGRVDRLKQLGNALMPQIAYVIGSAIKAYETLDRGDGMSKIDYFIQQIDKLEFQECMAYEDLLNVVQQLEAKRKEFKKTHDLLKAREDKVRQVILNKLIAEKQQSAKTLNGTVFQKTKTYLVTSSKEDFQSWLRENVISAFLEYAMSTEDLRGKLPVDKIESALADYTEQQAFFDNTDILLATPYSKPALTSWIGDGDPPPGVEFDSELKLGVRKN